MKPKERIFFKGDVMNALNIQKKQYIPKFDSNISLKIAINKLAYNLRSENKKSISPNQRMMYFFLTICKVCKKRA